MTNEADRLISSLQGRAWEIAATVQREIDAVAPYAELTIAMGVPTWEVGGRVVSLIPFTTKCRLHFWQGDTLEAIVPGRLRGTNAGPIRFLELRSLLDVDRSVRALIQEAFALQIRQLDAQDRRVSRNAALPF